MSDNFQLPPANPSGATDARGEWGRRLVRFVRNLAGSALLIVWLVMSAAAADFHVTQVFDGETLEIDGGKKFAVRLAGIDAPEASRFAGDPDQPFSQSARSLLATYTLNRMVDLKMYGTDADGHVLAEVFVGDRNVNLALLQAGLAEATDHPAAEGLNLQPYRRAEEEARRSGRGMWMQGNSYTSPREWRRSHGQ